MGYVASVHNEVVHFLKTGRYFPKSAPRGFFARIGHKNPGGHHPWISRDYEQLDCKAIGCMFNRNGECAVPSRAVLDDQAKCTGFKARPAPRGLQGD